MTFPFPKPDYPPPLAEAIAAFNRFPLRYADASWLPEDWTPDWIGRARDGGRMEARLGERLLRRWEMDTRPCLDFTSAGARFALLDTRPLLRLALLAGATLHAGAIARLVERRKVLECRGELGEDVYRFACLRAPLLAGALADSAIPEDGEGRACAGWRARCLSTGRRMLDACFYDGGGGNPGLLARVRLKFPRDIDGSGAGSVSGRRLPAAETGRAAAPAGAYARLLRKLAVQEVDPAWDALLS